MHLKSYYVPKPVILNWIQFSAQGQLLLLILNVVAIGRSIQTALLTAFSLSRSSVS